MSTIEYVVKEGDTLSEILYDLTGDGTYENYTQYAAANGIENPDHIVPGQVLTIPVVDSTSGGSASSSGGYNNVGDPALGTGVGSTVAGAYMNNSTGSSGSTGGSGYSGSNSSMSSSSAMQGDPRYSASGSNTSTNTTNAMQGDPRYSASSSNTSTNTTNGMQGDPRYSASGSNSSSSSSTSNSINSSARTSSTSSSASTSSSGMGFSYFVDDDTITYDLDTALVKLTELQDAIQNASDATSNLAVTLSDLQDLSHDKQGSVIVESFIDFEHLIGDAYEGTGIVGFVNDVSALSDEMYEYLAELQNRTMA